MSKSTKKTLIISGIIMVAWTLVILFVCKANACDKTGTWQKINKIYNNIKIGDMVETNDIIALCKGYRSMSCEYRISLASNEIRRLKND